MDSSGQARMVDVGGKAWTHREATARGEIRLNERAWEALRRGEAAKGDVLGVARTAGIMAAKRTPELIPLCHQLALSGVRVAFRRAGECLEIEAGVTVAGPTGAEMEALTAVSVAALTVYDMLKAVDRGMVIGRVRLIAKSGGKSGEYRRAGETLEGFGFVQTPIAGIVAQAAMLPRDVVEPQTDAGGGSQAINRTIRVGTLTASDRTARGERGDKSGPVIAGKVREFSGEVVTSLVVPDEREEIARALAAMADSGDVDLILTTGGTGCSPWDVTPEATRDVLEKEVPGILELLRREGFQATPRAALSRGVAGLRGKVLIINLPGSPRAVQENMSILAPLLPHALAVSAGEVQDCGRPMAGLTPLAKE